MDDSEQAAGGGAHAEWEARPWLLGGLLGLAGLLVWLILEPSLPRMEDSPWRAALAAFVGSGSLMLAFTLQEGEKRAAAVFSLVVALVMAGISWRVAGAADRYVDAPFWFFSGAVAGVLALPLFQAGFHRLRWQTSYEETHFHVWTDAISTGGAILFLGLSWLLLFLLSELFHAIKIDVLRDAIGEGWFGWTFSGAAFGAALGILRNNLAILGTLQRVVMLVFALLAVPLAAALAIFLVAVALSGPDVLWEATRSATPLLLSAAVGAFVLANAVLRDRDEHSSPSRIQRGAAAVLAVGILPLAVLAAVSVGARIAQHGLSPERLWALVAVTVAVVYGTGYFVAAILARRQGWDRLRRTNLHLAVGSCVLALLLALPILDFGAISARNQIARLESGAVAAKDFDYAALRWDFGDAGRAALARLAKSGKPEVAKLAKAEQARKQRYYPWQEAEIPVTKRLANLRTDIADPALRAQVEEHIRKNAWLCDQSCVVIDLGPAGGSGKGRNTAFVQGGFVNQQVVGDDTAMPMPAVAVAASDAAVAASDAGQDKQDEKQSATSKVELREWSGRRIYIDGKPAGPAFE